MAVRIQFRRDTAENWAADNRVLAEGELGLVLGDSPNWKMGDGTTAWNDLPFVPVQGSQGPQGEVGPVGAQGPAGAQGPVGPAGLTWRGLWSADTTYAPDDAVDENGASWFAATTPGVGVNPNPSGDGVTAQAPWALLSAVGAVGPQGPTGEQGPAGLSSILTPIAVQVGLPQ